MKGHDEGRGERGREPRRTRRAWLVRRRGPSRRRRARIATRTALLATAFALLLASCARTISAPASVDATPNGNSITISWQPVSGASEYDVFLSTSPNISTLSYSQETVTASTSTVISGLSIGATYYLVVAASSEYGFSVGPASNVVSVQLNGTPANPAPVITAISASPSIATAGSLVQLAASASDSDGDTLTYTWSVDGGTVAGPTANLNLYTWTVPAAATSGTSYTVGVQVTDGTTTVSATTSVTVQ